MKDSSAPCRAAACGCRTPAAMWVSCASRWA